MTKARDLASNSSGSKPTLIDAKADLIVGTGADAASRLAVGSNGDTIVADSAATTGLRWNINQSAGKNSIINGDFRINQRAFSSSATDGAYTFDRWMITALSWATGTVTYSAQTFTPGAAPVSGYEGINFLRCVTASLTGSTGYATITQRIEDVRTFAGQTVTMSLWAKAGSGTPNLSLEMVQNFGSGGSTRAPIAASVKKFTLSTSWTRYSFTFTVPSVSGKTIGTGSMLEFFVWYAAGSDYNSRTDSIGIQNGTFDIWGVQIEAGSVATAFQTATGTLQGELAACQRYFIGLSSTENAYTNFAVGVYGTTTIAQVMVPLPVTMRVKPSISVGTVGNYTVDGVAANVCSNLQAGQLANQMIGLSATTGASTLGYACYLRASNTTSALIQISAEL